MLCRKPFVRGMEAFGCGQCMPCRFNTRRIWTHRIMLEALVHADASFVTLTYDKYNLPDGGSVVPRDMQLFLKRVRKNVGRCRFFGVGEYGDHSWRPHYHLALFGIGPDRAQDIQKCWRYGFSYTGTLTRDSAQYVAGYVTKKLTQVNEFTYEKLLHRHPEFARMSNRPGIGALAIDQVAQALLNRHGWDSIERNGDVPTALRSDGRMQPLGRYMRRKLREKMNFKEHGQTEEAAWKASAEMLVMYKDYLLDNPHALGLKQALLEKGKVKAQQLETKMKIKGIKPL